MTSAEQRVDDPPVRASRGSAGSEVDVLEVLHPATANTHPGERVTRRVHGVRSTDQALAAHGWKARCGRAGGAPARLLRGPSLVDRLSCSPARRQQQG